MSSAIPYRQIRATYDKDTITVYQAYSSSIAIPAVENQKLDASPDFSLTRMTWIKPSWAWMMYRSGYSYKDERQAHILAVKMTHDGFFELLRKATLSTHEASSSAGDKTALPKGDVRVQWDPERTPALERLSYRSIQIGISGTNTKSDWINKWIVGIEDVTEKAQALKKALDENPKLSNDELLRMGLFPHEKPFDVPDDIYSLLRMDVTA